MLYQAAPYTARNEWKRNKFSLVKIVCAIKSDQTVRLVNYACERSPIVLLNGIQGMKNYDVKIF